MKRFSVVIEESAQDEIQNSYEWGCREWGKAQARKLARELRASVMKRLSTLPSAFPLAPEDDEFEEEIRQMIVGRYRVLFMVSGPTVHVLHLRGAYKSSIDDPLSE